jgi:hypothetical protein
MLLNSGMVLVLDLQVAQIHLHGQRTTVLLGQLLTAFNKGKRHEFRKTS